MGVGACVCGGARLLLCFFFFCSETGSPGCYKGWVVGRVRVVEGEGVGVREGWAGGGRRRVGRRSSEGWLGRIATVPVRGGGAVAGSVAV